MAEYREVEINDDVEAHKKSVTETFNNVAAGYDHPALRWFPFAADAVLEHLQIKPDTKLLDVATGTGVVAVSAAQYVRPTGRVIAVDLSDKMMEQAAAKARHLGYDNIDFIQMDGEFLEFKSDYFDYVICNFGLFFMPDMGKALQGWSRVCKPGGQMAFTSFTEAAFKPYMEILIDHLQEFGADLEEQTFSTQRLIDPLVCQQLLQDNGCCDVKSVVNQCGYHLSQVEDWWSILWNTGARSFLQKIETDRLAAFKRHHLDVIQGLFTGEGLWLDVEVNISTGIVKEK
jgi:ubiquinone/menaquinone biosynthesis C-methylase UbiE